MAERRNFQRVPFGCKAEIHYNGRKYPAELLNICLLGAMALCKDSIPLAEGNCCELSIHLLDSEITLQFDAKVIHYQKNRLGFQFISVDTETATHLRRLLELNIGSAEVIDKELAFWLKDR
jgi:hypothetical protein